MTLPNSAVCPSPISVAIDSTPASERRFDDGAPASSHFPSITENTEASVSEESQPLASKSRVALSLSRILRRGCNAPSMFASLSPKCSVTAGGGRVQPLGVEQLTQPQPKRIAKLVRPNKYHTQNSHQLHKPFWPVSLSYNPMPFGTPVFFRLKLTFHLNAAFIPLTQKMRRRKALVQHMVESRKSSALGKLSPSMMVQGREMHTT